MRGWSVMLSIHLRHRFKRKRAMHSGPCFCFIFAPVAGFDIA